jgi:uncharacterized radical SAM superfamily protein
VKLEHCKSCDGFVPASSLSCPHCGVRVVQGMTRARRIALAVVGGAAVSMTLAACYGAPAEGEGEGEGEGE